MSDRRFFCPVCGRQEVKKDFGYPICCNETMREGTPYLDDTSLDQNSLYNMITLLSDEGRHIQFSDWERVFLSNMAVLRTSEKEITPPMAVQLEKMIKKYRDFVLL